MEGHWTLVCFSAVSLPTLLSSSWKGTAPTHMGPQKLSEDHHWGWKGASKIFSGPIFSPWCHLDSDNPQSQSWRELLLETWHHWHVTSGGKTNVPSESRSVVSTLCDPMDYTVYGILQARILEWVAIPFSRGSSQPRNQSQVSLISGGFFTV